MIKIQWIAKGRGILLYNNNNNNLPKRHGELNPSSQFPQSFASARSNCGAQKRIIFVVSYRVIQQSLCTFKDEYVSHGEFKYGYNTAQPVEGSSGQCHTVT
jgi:hypothetical protein